MGGKKRKWKDKPGAVVGESEGDFGGLKDCSETALSLSKETVYVRRKASETGHQGPLTTFSTLDRKADWEFIDADWKSGKAGKCGALDLLDGIDGQQFERPNRQTTAPGKRSKKNKKKAADPNDPIHTNFAKLIPGMSRYPCTGYVAMFDKPGFTTRAECMDIERDWNTRTGAAAGTGRYRGDGDGESTGDAGTIAHLSTSTTPYPQWSPMVPSPSPRGPRLSQRRLEWEREEIDMTTSDKSTIFPMSTTIARALPNEVPSEGCGATNIPTVPVPPAAWAILHHEHDADDLRLGVDLQLREDGQALTNYYTNRPSFDATLPAYLKSTSLCDHLYPPPYVQASTVPYTPPIMAHGHPNQFGNAFYDDAYLYTEPITTSYANVDKLDECDNLTSLNDGGEEKGNSYLFLALTPPPEEEWDCGREGAIVLEPAPDDNLADDHLAESNIANVCLVHLGQTEDGRSCEGHKVTSSSLDPLDPLQHASISHDFHWFDVKSMMAAFAKNLALTCLAMRPIALLVPAPTPILTPPPEPDDWCDGALALVDEDDPWDDFFWYWVDLGDTHIDQKMDLELDFSTSDQSS